MMRRIFLAVFSVMTMTTLMAWHAGGQVITPPGDGSKSTTDTESIKKKITADEQIQKRLFDEFEKKLSRLKQQFENGTPEEQARAKVLEKVLEQARSADISLRYEKLITTLQSSKLNNLVEIENALKESHKIAEDLRKLLDTYKAGDLTRSNADEINSLKKFIKELENIILKQKITEALTKDNRSDTPGLQGKQGDISKEIQKLLDKMSGKKGEPGGEAKDTRGESKDAGKGEGPKGDPKDAGKGNEAKPGQGKDGGKDNKEGKGNEGAAKGKGNESKDGGDPNKSGKEGKDGDGQGGQAKDGGKEGKDGQGKKGDAKSGDGMGKEGESGNAKEGGKAGDSNKQPSASKEGGDSKPGMPQPGDAKNQGPKGGEGSKSGMGDPKNGMGDPKSGMGDPKGGSPKGGAKDAKGGEAKAAGAKGGDPKGGEGSKSGKASDSKSGAQGGQGKSKSGDKADGQGQSKDSGSKGGMGSPSQGGQGQSKEGGQQGGEGGSKSGPQNQQDQKTANAKKQIQDSEKYSKEAEKKIGVKDNPGAGDDQKEVVNKLNEAKRDLERLLQQMREEELERLLGELIGRCQLMLRMQEEVLVGTLDVHDKIEKRPGKVPDRLDKIDSNGLSKKEGEIVKAADLAIQMLEAEGTAVAFPEVFQQVREDMVNVQKRLALTDAGDVTIAIEKDIIATLKEMIDALKQAQKDQKAKKSDPKDSKSQPPNQNKKLLELIAELKMIRSMQIRVNKRTETYGNEYKGEQAAEPRIVRELQDLSNRQDRIAEVTTKLYKKENQ
jgi:hypothetical protein